MNSLQIPNRIAMPCPFGGFGTDNITEIATVSGNDVNFLEGFPSSYAAPSSNDGRFVTRKEMNAIGNLASRDLFYHKCGGLNTFDPKFCAAIGGYPKGAVLQYAVANQIFEVMSLVENNMIDFTGSGSGIGGIIDGSVDGINWVYCNKEIPSTGRVVLSSGDSSYISVGDTSGRVVDIVTIPANGYIVGSVSIEYGDLEIPEGSWNAVAGSGGYRLAGGGLFAKKISGSESAILNSSTITSWTLLGAANQNGELKVRYQPSASSYAIVNAFLTSPCVEYNPSTKPQIGSLNVLEGDVLAIATLASSRIGSMTVPTGNIYPGIVNTGTTIKVGGYSVTLSIS